MREPINLGRVKGWNYKEQDLIVLHQKCFLHHQLIGLELPQRKEMTIFILKLDMDIVVINLLASDLRNMKGSLLDE